MQVGPAPQLGPASQSDQAQPNQAVQQAVVPRAIMTQPALPAFHRVLVFFARTCKEEAQANRSVPEDFLFLKEWEQGMPPPPETAATSFLRSLPHVYDPAQIPEGRDPDCAICTLQFAPWTAPTADSDGHQSVAKALPCGHYFCCNCLYDWVKPHTPNAHDKCPFCLSILFVNWMQFYQLVGGHYTIHGWPTGDLTRQILKLEEGLDHAQNEFNRDFQHWQAFPEVRFAVSGYGTQFTPAFVQDVATASAGNITPTLVLHERARKAFDCRAKILKYIRDWIAWRRFPHTLRPLLGSAFVGEIFKLRRKQEWDPSGRLEADARVRGEGSHDQ